MYELFRPLLARCEESAQYQVQFFPVEFSDPKLPNFRVGSKILNFAATVGDVFGVLLASLQFVRSCCR